MRVTAYSWYVVFVLGLAQILAGLDRTIVALLAEPIRVEFALSDSEIGLLAGLAFAVPFAIAGIPLGLLIDRTNRVRLLAAMIAVWSSLTAVCAFAGSFVHLLLARAGTGAAEAGGSPCEVSILSDYFPRARMATAMGIFSLATPLGFILGFGVGGIIAEAFGWRSAFLVAGAPGLVVSLLILATIRNVPRASIMAPSADAARLSFLRVIAERRAMLMIIVGAGLLLAAHAGIITFLGAFLARTHDVPLNRIGILIGMGIGLGGLLGTPLSGVIADKLEATGGGRQLLLPSTMMICAAVAIVSAMFVKDIAVFSVLLCVYAFCNATYAAPTFASFVSLAPAQARGACVAMMIVVGNLAGNGFGPQLTGMLSDLSVQAGFVSPLRVAISATAGLYILSAIAYLLAWKSFGASADPRTDDQHATARWPSEAGTPTAR